MEQEVRAPSTPTMIRTPFVMRANLSNQSVRQLQMEAQLVGLPIPLYDNHTQVAFIIGVGQSGNEFVQEIGNNVAFSGLNALVERLAQRRAYRTRHVRETARQRMRVCLRGKRITLEEWQDALCGWADTHQGTMACIKSSLELPAVVPRRRAQEQQRQEQQQRPNGIIRLPEPPLRAIPYFQGEDNRDEMEGDEMEGDEMEGDEMVQEEDYSEEEWGEMLSDDDSLPDLLEDPAETFQEMVQGVLQNAAQGLQDDAAVASVVRDVIDGEGLLTLSSIIQHARRQCPTECTICCGDLTPGLAPPCRNPHHAICGGCLKRHATNWSCHCVSASTPFVSCPHEGCEEAYPLATVAEHVANPRDMEKLEARIAHYVERQTVKFACPACHHVNRVPGALVKDRPPGSLAVRCQAQGCGLEFCWHCLDHVAVGSANQQGFVLRSICAQCEARTAHAIPPRNGEFNRFVPKQEGAVGIIPRNYELTVQDCVAQLNWISTSKQLATRCRACSTPMHRTSACAELTHCGLRQCTVCGMAGLEFESNLIDHWAGHGRLGQCPRWTTDRFWKQTVRCEHRCKEGPCGCHDDNRDCTVKAHDNYKAQVLEVRRLRHFKCLMQSLPAELQRLVVEEILRGGAQHRPMADLLTKIRLAHDFGGLV
jgi:hypothetical protein